MSEKSIDRRTFRGDFEGINIEHILNEIETATDNQKVSNLIKPDTDKLARGQARFYRVKELSFSEDYPHREALENVLLSIDNLEFNFVYVLTGHKDGVTIDIGAVKNSNFNKDGESNVKLSATNHGDNIGAVFKGNFSGSQLELLEAGVVESDLLENDYKCSGVIMGIPSMNKKKDGDSFDYQGIDRLIDAMMGQEWRIAVVCEPVSKFEIRKMRKDIYQLYTDLSIRSKQNIQGSANSGGSYSHGTTQSKVKGKTIGTSESRTKGKSSGTQDEEYNSSKNSSESKGSSNSASESYSSGTSTNSAISRGSSLSVTLEMVNKPVQELIKYIDEEMIERLNQGISQGLFKTSVYYMAKEPVYLKRLEAAITAIVQGDRASLSPLFGQEFREGDCETFNLLNTYQNQYVKSENCSEKALNLLGRPVRKSIGTNTYYHIGLSTYLTASEVTLFAGLPQKEVPGVALKEAVDFGLNETVVEEKDRFYLGKMVQKGKVLEAPFYLSKESLSKHTFVAGVTGSGKTTTCQKLLAETDVPFLVIEPAKTEYRALLNSEKYKKELIVFTLGDEMTAPFRINPFELIPGELISSHVDMMKATFTSAFPMEASMPQILEESIYRCYEQMGWDTCTNENKLYGKEAYKIGYFPILSDLLAMMKQVVNDKQFGAELRANYIGSLVSRLSNLTVGSKGSMLNCTLSTNFDYIITHNVVMEMEEIKSSEDKALIMGFVLSRMAASIKKKFKETRKYRHLTLVEEAHRLLAKVVPGEGGARKAAVETFTDMLAEVRKYGEGMVIVDQIPNKLAPEVLKNTNTKIIHKIFAADDKDAVGDTMMMDDKQKKYLSALQIGEAIVFSEVTRRPVHVTVEKLSDISTSDEIVEENILKEHFQDYCKEQGDAAYDKLHDMVIKNHSHFKSMLCELKCMAKRKKYEKNKIQEMRDVVKKIKECTEKEEKEIWKAFLVWQTRITGNSVGDRKIVDRITKAVLKYFTERLTDIEESYPEADVCKYLLANH